MADDRAIEYEALIAEIQAICIEIEGLKWENEIWKHRGDPMPYGERVFFDQAERIREIAQKMRNLK